MELAALVALTLLLGALILLVAVAVRRQSAGPGGPEAGGPEAAGPAGKSRASSAGLVAPSRS